MKQYVIDGLRPQDFIKIQNYLNEHFEVSSLDGIYWIELKTDLLTSTQKAHEGCRPHVFALVLENASLSAELLVRIKSNIKCDCMGYANQAQREWLIQKMDSIMEKLEIQI